MARDAASRILFPCLTRLINREWRLAFTRPASTHSFDSPVKPARPSFCRNWDNQKNAAMTPHSTEENPIPEALRKIADNPRVRIRRPGALAPDAKCVVYWMQRAQRALDNHALDIAVE